MSAAEFVTPEYMAAHYGVTVDHYKANRLELLRDSLTAKSGRPHSIFLSPRGPVVYCDTMGAMMGYPKAKRRA